MPSSATGNAIVTVSSRAVTRLRSGHPWVYRSDVVNPGNAAAGAVVDIGEERGRLLGTALYSSASAIAVRMISRDCLPQSEVLSQLIPQRIQAALEYRERVVFAGNPATSNAYRLIFSEGDQLPGLIADRYNDIVTVQALTQAFDRADFRATLLAPLATLEGVNAIVERVDDRIRALEQLPVRASAVVWRRDAGASPEGEHSLPAAPAVDQLPATVFSMNGVRFRYEALAGQKTGAFLDQRENYAAVERFAHGEGLDCFCYHGGFALHMARRCSSIIGVDSSRPALEAAEKNAALNGQELEWIEANAFDLLRDYADAGRQYDTIVLDPPAFAKSKSALPAALRGYKELNLRALKMLRPGGILATCSCSYHVSPADFAALLASAAADSGRAVRVLERRGASLDHPAIITIPETAYLKCFIVSV